MQSYVAAEGSFFTSALNDPVVVMGTNKVLVCTFPFSLVVYALVTPLFKT